MNNKEVMGNMLSVIRTAMITIIISFTSGVLLDLYKNVAPRIVCKMIRCKNRDSNNIKEYDLSIKNVSKKTIHNLNIHIQSEALCESFKVDNENITYGLKFDMSEEENIYSINIPFLSKNDEFSAKIVLEDSHNVNNKPIVILRSPDNFKRVDTLKYKLQTGSNSFKKKALIALTSLILIIFAGVMVCGILSNKEKDIEEPTIESSEEDITNSEEKTSTSGTSNSSNKKSPSKNNTNSTQGEKTNNSAVTKEENKEESKESSSSETKENVDSTSKQEGASEESSSSDKKETISDGKVNENTSSSTNSNSKLDSSSETKGTNSNVDSNINGTSKSIE